MTVGRTAWQQQRLSQLLLVQHYQARRDHPLSFADVGFSVNSQNDEDGVLLYVFSQVGFKTRIAVEMAAGDGIECNSANLLLHHGFTAVLFESDAEKRARGQAFYAAHPATSYFPPRFVGEWITQDNAAALVRQYMFSGVLPLGEIDLLSLDLDGNDYWILQEVVWLRPRVIILEFNALWGAERAVTIPYDPDFRVVPGPIAYCGASLPAFVKFLGTRKYRLVGVERLGFNAVFVRNDLARATLPEVSADAALRGPIVGICQAALAADPALGAEVRARPWVNV